jgi:hypothetical protein
VKGDKLMMDFGMMGSGSMMWAMGLIALLVTILLVFAIAALAKYLFSGCLSSFPVRVALGEREHIPTPQHRHDDA